MPGPGVTNAQILIGMTNDLSGAGMTPYAAITEAAKAYFEAVNEERGGVCGRSVVLQVEDDSYAPHLAAERAKKLVEQNQVLAMIGGIGTEVHAPVAAYLNDPNADANTSDGIPDLFVTTGWSGWANPAAFPWTTSLIPDYKTDGAVLGEYIKANFPDQPAALLYKNDVYGIDYADALRAVLPAIAQQAYEPTVTDVTAQVAAIQATGAQVVVLATTPDVAIGAIKAAQAANYAPRWLLSSTIAPSTLATQLGGGATAEALAEGFRQLDGSITTAYLLSNIENDTNPAIVEHARIMETYDGPPVSSLSVYGQTLAEAVAETLSRACANLTRPGVQQAAESLVGFRTSMMLPGIDVNLSPTDHLAVQALQPMQIRATGDIVPAGDLIDLEPAVTPTPVATSTPRITPPTPSSAPADGATPALTSPPPAP